MFLQKLTTLPFMINMTEPAPQTGQLVSTANTQVNRSSTVVSLELLRGLASLDVFLWHLLNSKISLIYIPGLYRALAWSKESVIIFFVLSGYVISLSQQRLHRPAAQFLKARFKRIEPIYLISLAAAILVSSLIHSPITLWQAIGHLFFLQSYEGTLVPPIAANGPLWSLGTEFEFYMAFTFILLLNKPSLLLAWWWLAIAGMLIRHMGYLSSGFDGLFLEFLGLSPCWLVGYFAAGFRCARSLTLVQAVTLFLMIPLVSNSDFGSMLKMWGSYDDLKCYFLALLIAPLIHTLAVRQLYPEAKPLKQGWLIVLITYVCVVLYALLYPAYTFPRLNWLILCEIALAPPAFYVLGHLFLPAVPVWPINSEVFRKTAVFLGGGSFALYAIHVPVLVFVEYFVSNHYLQFPFVILIVASCVLFLEYLIQPRMAFWIDRIL